MNRSKLKASSVDLRDTKLYKERLTSMKNHFFFRISGIPLFSILLAFTAVAREPNVIFILADDMGYGELGCYGQKEIFTPQLDRLAEEGMRFTHFFAGSTVCAPSRSVLMTGQHVGHTRVRGNSRENNYAGQTLSPDDFTVADLMKMAGYETALIGKWGLGDIDSAGTPDRLGFDHYFGYLNQTHAHNQFPSFLWRDGERVDLPNDIIPSDKAAGAGYSTNQLVWSNTLFFAEARNFIRKHSETPFFLYLALVVPHANNERSEALEDGMEVPDYGRYVGQNWPDFQKGHAAMDTQLDREVGVLLDLLDALSLSEDTIVIFTSDNGPHQEGGPGYDPEFFDSNGPWTGIKRDLTDGGVRVPMIVRWPGRIQPGSVSNHIGYFGDILATLAEVTDIPAPTYDGLSLVPVMTGQGMVKAHPYLYWEFYEGRVTQAVLLEGRWKGLRFSAPDGPIILFDQSVDPGETTDCSADHPDIVARIAEIMKTAHVANENWKIEGL